MTFCELPLKNTGGWHQYSGALTFTAYLRPGRGNCVYFAHGRQGVNLAGLTVTLRSPAVSAGRVSVDYAVAAAGGGASIEAGVAVNFHIETATCEFAQIDGGAGGEAQITLHYGTPREGARLRVSVNGGGDVTLLLDAGERERCFCNPSGFIRDGLLYVQEIGQEAADDAVRAVRGQALPDQAAFYLHLILTRGEGTLTSEGRSFSLEAGEQLFLDVRAPYVWESAEPYEMHWLHFNGPTMPVLYAYFLERDAAPVFRVSGEQLPEYLSLHRELLTLSADTGVSAELLSANLLNTLLTRLLTLPDGTESLPLGRKMAELRDYLDVNYAEPLTLDALATHFQISKYHMARQFKLQYDISIINYVNRCRISRSKELLRYTSLPIRDVAEAVGIADSAYFNRLFRRAEGLSASAYRRTWGKQP